MNAPLSRAREGLAEVVRFPTRAGAERARSVLERLEPHPEDVDDWGRDPGLLNRIRALSTIRWHVTVGGFEHLPIEDGALVVVNARRFALTPIMTAFALGDRLDRPVRFLGRPDVAPVGPLVQRLGGLLDRTDELSNVLRSGELVVMGTEPTRISHQVGCVDHHLISAAVTTDTPVFPAAATSAPHHRGARVEIGPAVAVRGHRRGPLAELELADDLHAAIVELLEGFGSTGGVLA